MNPGVGGVVPDWISLELGLLVDGGMSLLLDVDDMVTGE